jgi:polyhydroxybutyrate depolymerase
MNATSLRWTTQARIALLFLALLAPRHAVACGIETDCTIGDRSYRIALPDGHDDTERIGAVIFVHGFRGTAAGVMRNHSLTDLASEMGIAFVAAQAAGPEWNIPHIPSIDALEGVDELSYFDALVEDLVTRANVDRAKIVVAGFSSGAMMTWHLACYRGDRFAGFVPMSGTFWKPIPETCPTGPVNLLHYHGRNDPVVPLAGRPIKDARQGNVSHAIALIRQQSDYQPEIVEQPPGLDCSGWTDSGNHLLELCLFDGKHTLKLDNLVRALRQLLDD